MASKRCPLFDFDNPPSDDDTVTDSSSEDDNNEDDKNEDENESPALPAQHSATDTITVQQKVADDQAVDPDGIAIYTYNCVTVSVS